MKKYSDQRKAAILAAYGNRGGISAREFAQKYKVPVTTIWGWLGKKAAKSGQPPAKETKPVEGPRPAAKPGSKKRKPAPAQAVAELSGLSQEARQIISDLLFENYLLKRRLGER